MTSIVDLGTLGGVGYEYIGSEATGVNDSGQVVGSSYVPDGTFYGFLYSGGTMSDLGTLPGGSESVATGINDSG